MHTDCAVSMPLKRISNVHLVMKYSLRILLSDTTENVAQDYLFQRGIPAQRNPAKRFRTALDTISPSLNTGIVANSYRRLGRSHIPIDIFNIFLNHDLNGVPRPPRDAGSQSLVCEWTAASPANAQIRVCCLSATVRNRKPHCDMRFQDVHPE